MKIWVDADACPKVVTAIIVRAAHQRKIESVFVTNKTLLLPESPFVSSIVVDNKPDEADKYICDHASQGDLVITQDIPLAHALVTQSIDVIDQRGGQFTEDNAGERLATRNMMQEMRDAGQLTGGPAQFGDREKRAFASTFDRMITRLTKRGSA